MNNRSSKDFKKSIIKRLNKSNYRFLEATFLPDKEGSFLNGVKGYQLIKDDSELIIRDYNGILELANSLQDKIVDWTKFNSDNIPF